ncbi:TolC family protein [Nitrosovibrio sp. Nv4]|uniref:TolC family protein n=1 Tax=Nitrosovibrio sp. Nv4 TaxID=1945880 RepID=UPI000BC931A7|nr:TolC family protein [Nitrosovibrio sp. Nv4]SOD41269.1 outer membrane protein, cobalt-zinc-cadmium efflux system [Nitrosovibrio sp. Nv4]
MRITPFYCILPGLILVLPFTPASAQGSATIPEITVPARPSAPAPSPPAPVFAPAPAPTPVLPPVPGTAIPATVPYPPAPSLPSGSIPTVPSTGVPSTEPSARTPTVVVPSVPASAVPEGSLSIEALQRLGLQANGLVRAAAFQVDMAGAGVVGAAAYPNPQVSVIGGPQDPRIPAANPGTNTRQVTISQPIENPFVRSARIDSAEAGVEASRASFDQVRADLAAQLRVRAYELLLRQEIARMEASIHNLMEEVRRRIKVGVDVGETARFELIRADAEVLNAASRQEAAVLNAQRARIALLQLTAGALKPDFTIDASLFDPVNLPPLAELREEVPAVNPDVLRLLAESERSRRRIDQERAMVLPSVDVVYSNYQDAQYTDNRGGLRVTVPLLYRRRGEIDAAVADSARVRETLEYRRFEIGQLLESAWQALQIAQRRVEMFEGGIIKEAEAALRVAQAAYRLGERPLIEVLDTQRVLRGILAESLQARFDLQAAAAEIDRLRAYYPREQVLE